MRRTACIVLLLLVYWMTAAAAFTDVQWEFDCAFAQQEYRKHLGFALGWSLLPPAWFIAPFMTGFYEHGINWTFHRRTDCEIGGAR